MKQAEYIHDFAKKSVIPFNKKVFTRSDADIINALKKIILSCQRDTPAFKILVRDFKVISSFYEVNETLRKYQDMLMNKKSSKSKSDDDNRYNFIDLKSSALKLLIPTYYTEIKGDHDEFDVIIAVPRVVDKFYFYINGTYNSSMFQIVDGSTYNNATSRSNSHCVTLKTAFHPVRIFRNIVNIYDYHGEVHEATHYDCIAFKKCVPTALYIIAQYGLYGAVEFFGIGSVIHITDTPMDDENFYSFQPQYRGEVKDSMKIYIGVPKMIFDKNAVVQHFVNTLCNQIFLSEDVTFDKIFTNDFWLERLGSCYTSSKTADRVQKGLNVLISIRGVYDIATRENIRLPEWMKSDIFRVLQWIICEYNNLKLKDNLDIRTKRINIADYIAAMYANKLVYGIYNLSDNARADIKTIRKALITNPLFLVNKVSRSQLIPFRNTVTDMDAIAALKCTYKGESGIGEASAKSIPKIYRFLDLSNMGILDPDSSSSSDPGISGSVVPSIRLYGNGFFSDYKEPVTWLDEYAQLYDGYRKQRGLVEVMKFSKEVFEPFDHFKMNQPQVDVFMAKEGLEMVKSMAEILTPEEEISEEIPLEGSGTIVYGE